MPLHKPAPSPRAPGPASRHRPRSDAPLAPAHRRPGAPAAPAPAEQEREADRARWAAERAEQAAQAEQLRKDTLEGLMDIQTKHGALLTNFEAAALAEAIKAVSR